MKKKILLVSLLTAGMLFSCTGDKTPATSGSTPAAGSTSSTKSTASQTSVAPKYKVTFDLNYTGAAKGTVKTA
ncbi:MAG: hypothetical protein IKI55_02515, partial [Bacilli bacterium]|nr:hypothetical protein [Bacilli bacterium]